MTSGKTPAALNKRLNRRYISDSSPINRCYLSNKESAWSLAKKTSWSIRLISVSRAKKYNNVRKAFQPYDKRGGIFLVRRLSIISFAMIFAVSLFAFGGSASAAAFKPKAEPDVSILASGGTVGIYGANMRSCSKVSCSTITTFSSGKKITGSWVTGEYVQGHYTNSNKWLKVTYAGATGYVSVTTLSYYYGL